MFKFIIYTTFKILIPVMVVVVCMCVCACAPLCVCVREQAKEADLSWLWHDASYIAMSEGVCQVGQLILMLLCWYFDFHQSQICSQIFCVQKVLLITFLLGKSFCTMISNANCWIMQAFDAPWPIIQANAMYFCSRMLSQTDDQRILALYYSQVFSHLRLGTKILYKSSIITILLVLVIWDCLSMIWLSNFPCS